MTTDQWKNLGWMIGVVFVGAILSQYIALVVNLTDIDQSTAEMLLNSGVTAVVTTVLAYIAPMYKGFGIGAPKE